MSDSLRGFVLPGFLWPEPDDLLSALLVWEELEIEVWSGAAPLGADSVVERRHADKCHEEPQAGRPQIVNRLHASSSKLLIFTAQYPTSRAYAARHRL